MADARDIGGHVVVDDQAACARSGEVGEVEDTSGRSRLKQDLMLVPLVFVVVVGIWQFVSATEIVNPIILPTPTSIAGSFWDLIRADWFPPHLYTTVIETVVGFVLGCGAGVILGILLANLSLFRRLAYPYIIAFQVMPKVVLAPIFLTWFGFGMNSKIALAAAICFFPVLVNTVLGLESIEENAVLLMRSLVATRLQIFTKVAFPNALPAIFAGLETSATIALIGALVGEFVTAKQGLGLLLTTFNMQLKISWVFATIVVISIVGLILFGAVVLAKYKIVFWQRDWQKEVQ
ncbi:MAG: ABC transporter permease [Thermoleophilia bacterium]|nr:ABC transporter permease [Thermoleophilia bacterium]